MVRARPRLARMAASLGALVLAAGCGRVTHGVAGPTASVSPAATHVGLGQRVSFTADLGGDSVAWSVPGSLANGYVSRGGVYYAPLRMPPEPLIAVRANSTGRSLDAVVKLVPAAVTPAACFGATQLDTRAGDVFVDELPEAVVKVAPVYPDSAREYGIEGTVTVMAHVCACGEVMETRMAFSIPALDAAAMTAVAQWIFSPGLRAGEPLAVWVAVPVRFTLH